MLIYSNSFCFQLQHKRENLVECFLSQFQREIRAYFLLYLISQTADVLKEIFFQETVAKIERYEQQEKKLCKEKTKFLVRKIESLKFFVTAEEEEASSRKGKTKTVVEKGSSTKVTFYFKGHRDGFEHNMLLGFLRKAMP
jgi:hypothetical protein